MATVCQAVLVSAMLTLIECDRLDQGRLYRFGELLEQACACPCMQNEPDCAACLAGENTVAAD